MPSATRHLVCSAHRPAGAPPFEPRWRSETVMALARGITADWAFDRLPILADALEEAGCDDPVLLRHCRECNHHTAHCWVLGDLFDRPPVPEPRRLSEDEVRREVEFITGRRVETGHDGPAGRGPTFRLWKLAPLLVAVGVATMVRIGCSVIPHKSVNFPTHTNQFPRR